MTTRKTSQPTAKRLSQAQELAKVRASVKYLKANPQEGIALMARAGICTADGRLKKAYGGAA